MAQAERKKTPVSPENQRFVEAWDLIKKHENFIPDARLLEHIGYSSRTVISEIRTGRNYPKPLLDLLITKYGIREQFIRLGELPISENDNLKTNKSTNIQVPTDANAILSALLSSHERELKDKERLIAAAERAAAREREITDKWLASLEKTNRRVELLEAANGQISTSLELLEQILDVVSAEEPEKKVVQPQRKGSQHT